jgi:hypothetical protein
VRADRVAGTALALLGLFVLWECRQLPVGSLRTPGPAYMPMVLALLLVGFGALVAVFGGASARLREAGWHEVRHALAILLACAFAALAVERLGYRITMALMLLFLVGVVERRGALVAVVFSLALVLATFFLFDTVLRVPLARGPFGI